MTELLFSIPAITDPLGKHWEQPDTREIRLAATIATMNKQTLDKLKDYSMSQPTGVYVGKMWKCKRQSSESGWMLCWFGVSSIGPTHCSNNYRDIVIEE